ncbi:MAG: bifunctional phosphoribosylaminoimidazolecarboxamide formyltransferase/IMP cyclohydrolase [Ardenticatenia bacterium]|nr:bifunctional phosphoribosylaminoimidazolecarboxamide formyltransferase/IMP cyclohydrolase [Ardenticatenia bacterium]
MISRALISVSDKRGVVELAHALVELNVEIVSTGGTAQLLRENGIPVTPVEEVTGYPEMLGGRVKTLHPAVHGALLARPDHPGDAEDLMRHGIVPFDLVVVNLYPFEATVAQQGITLEQAVEQIDIGGVALLRAAAKNFHHVTVVSDPEDYALIVEMLRHHGGVNDELKAQLAVKAFQVTARYDVSISIWLAARVREHKVMPIEERFSPVLTLHGVKATTLRYGENPHQQAALYRRPGAGGLAHAEQLHGKAMSYTNWLDAEAAWLAVSQFDRPAVAIVKHASPCGMAVHDHVAVAYRHALASDPVSAFGGIVAVNQPLDVETAREITQLFTEVVLAPDFAPEALGILKGKANLRLLRVPPLQFPEAELDVRAIPGGFIVQTRDGVETPITMRPVTERHPTAEETRVLEFAWRAVLAVKSNAVLLARPADGGIATVGMGIGQPSRVDAVRLAVQKAGQRAEGAVLASDAFFPFPDGVEVAAEAGVAAIIQPGGSRRDADVIRAADRAGMAMVFTGTRHFRH